MTTRVELSLQGAIDQLHIAWHVGEAALERVAFDRLGDGRQICHDVLIAIQEMLTNVIRHGYGLDVSEPVVLRYQASPSLFVVEIRDVGPPFDPLSHIFEQPVDGSMPERPGGYGIHLAQQIMDGLEYERDGEWNVLRMFRAAPSGDQAGLRGTAGAESGPTPTGEGQS